MARYWQFLLQLEFVQTSYHSGYPVMCNVVSYLDPHLDQLVETPVVYARSDISERGI